MERYVHNELWCIYSVRLSVKTNTLKGARITILFPSETGWEGVVEEKDGCVLALGLGEQNRLLWVACSFLTRSCSG